MNTFKAPANSNEADSLFPFVIENGRNSQNLENSESVAFQYAPILVNQISSVNYDGSEKGFKVMPGESPDRIEWGTREEIASVRPLPFSIYTKSTYLRKNLAPSISHQFQVLQKWEGIVIEKSPDHFRVRLIDKTHNGPEEEGEIGYDEISDDDQDLIRVGAVFYWSIGYNNAQSGRTTISDIRFRRLPVWTEKDLEEAKVAAKKTADILKW